MGHVDGFPDKDGIAKLVKLGKALCALVATFSPLILKKYPDNELINSLLLAISGVCALIPQVESEFIDKAGNNDIPLDTPGEIPGIDPSRPPAPDIV
jgi:hypothetical protein